MRSKLSPRRGYAAPAQPALALTPAQFEWLRDLLSDYSGFHMDASQQRVLEVGLAQRLSATGDDLRAYERRIQTIEGRAELGRLAELVLNHETFFFRNKPHMRALRQVLLPELHRRKPAGAPLRIWSAGCATGEEPYSLAITALETLGERGRPVQIWATDLSHQALYRAQTGYYQGRALANVTPDLLERYFHPQGRGYTVGEALRKVVRFEQLNLLEPFPPAAQGVDIIFCQNVMIYFQLETCRLLLERFHACLPVGGLLFLGFSEMLWNIYTGFQAREVAGAYVYFKEAGAARPPAFPQAFSSPRQDETQPDLPGGQLRHTRQQSSVTPSPVPALDIQTAVDSPAQTGALRVATRLLGEDRSDQALHAPRPISPESPRMLQVIMLCARIHADRGELELALAAARRALEIDPMIDEAHMLIGAIYGRQGWWTAAAQQFERARYVNPASPLISFQLAEAYRQANRLDRALREYRSALRKLEPHPPDAVLDGVAVTWLREICRRQIDELSLRRPS